MAVDWRRKEIPLGHFTPETLQLFDLVLVFSAFRDNLKPQTVSQTNDEPDNFVTFVIGIHVGNENPIDLERMEREFGKAAQ